jgi:hypothetical protein
MFANATLLSAQPDVIEFEINQNAPLTASVHAVRFARNAYRLETTVDGGYPEYTYNWYPETGLDDPHSSSPVLLVSKAADKYSLEIVDNKGCTITVEFFSDSLTGIGNLHQTKQKVTAVFDEENRSLQISFAKAVMKAEIALYDMQGREMMCKILENIREAGVISLDIGNLDAGVYPVRIKTENFQQSEKIVVK